MLLKIMKYHFYWLKLGCGSGTNTRDELLDLWGLLKFTDLEHIKCIKVYGYSKTIIDWVTEKADIQIPLREHWGKYVKLFIKKFVSFFN